MLGVVKYSGTKTIKSKDMILNHIEHNSGHKSLSVPCVTHVGGTGRQVSARSLKKNRGIREMKG